MGRLPRDAVAFYKAAVGAIVRHRVGDGDEIVAQLGVGEASFWGPLTSSSIKRLSTHELSSGTSRTLLVVQDPGTVIEQAVAAGATEAIAACTTHGWRTGRIIDPFGHE